MTSKSEGQHSSLESLQSFTCLCMPHNVILPNYSPPPSHMRPDASRLRTVHSSCADGDRSETIPPQTLQQRRITRVASLMTFHCFSKSTVLFDSPSRMKTSWDWQVTQTAVLVVRSLARHFCFSRGGHGVTTVKYITLKHRSREESHDVPVTTSRAQTFHDTPFGASIAMSMFFDMSIARPRTSYRNASQFPWKTDAILAFSQAALRRTFEPP